MKKKTFDCVEMKRRGAAHTPLIAFSNSSDLKGFWRKSSAPSAAASPISLALACSKSMMIGPGSPPWSLRRRRKSSPSAPARSIATKLKSKRDVATAANASSAEQAVTATGPSMAWMTSATEICAGMRAS